MMELVDDDVVERIGRKSLQMLHAPKRLDRGKQHLDAIELRVAVGRLVASGAGLRPDLAKRTHRLVEDLIAVGHKEHARELQVPRRGFARRIECRQIGFA